MLTDSTRASVPEPRTYRSRLDAFSQRHRTGLTIFAVATGLFAALTGIVLFEPGWLSSFDTSVTTQLADGHNAWLNRVMHVITLLGDRIVIGAMLLSIAIWALTTGRCRTPVIVLVSAFLANPILEAALKGLVGRERPDVARLVSGDGPAFPSGHVLATVGFYGVLGIIAWRSTTRRGRAVGISISSAVVIALVGFSRIYLGVHWMTDVVGGLLVGAAFVLATAYFLRDHHFGSRSRCAAESACVGLKDDRSSPSRHDRDRATAGQPVRVPSNRAR